MPRRRRYRSSGSSSGSPWWTSGVYAVGLGVALFVILTVTGNSDRPGFMHQMFFGSTSDEADTHDAIGADMAESPSLEGRQQLTHEIDGQLAGEGSEAVMPSSIDASEADGLDDEQSEDSTGQTETSTGSAEQPPIPIGD